MKKKLSTILVFCLIISMVPTSIEAKTTKSEKETNTKVVKSDISADDKNTNEVSIKALSSGAITISDEDPTSTDLEKVVTTVKSKITIPKSYVDFSHSYDENSDDSGLWRLEWSTKGNTKQIFVSCDVKGNIMSYDSRTNNNGYNAPKYLKSELKDNAEKFIKKSIPEVTNKLSYVSSTYDGIYSGEYTFFYNRVENGIPMPDNTVSITMNYGTGKVTSLSVNWIYNVVIPNKEINVSKDQAMRAIGNGRKMKLSYFNAYDKSSEDDLKIHTFLAYVPDSDYISVDAKTGAVYKSNLSSTSSTGFSNGNVSKEKDSSSSQYVKLTENEINSIKELEGIITKKQAVNIITSSSSLYLDEHLKKASASLMKTYADYSNQTKRYVWRINLSDPREIDYQSGDTYRASASAIVDAKTGKILEFYANVPQNDEIDKEKTDTKVKYTVKESQVIFERFAKEVMPERFEKSRLYSNDNDYVIFYSKGEPVYGGYMFNYKRVNEGVDYIYNGISGAVDGVTGKIYNFSSEWYDSITFESTKGVISKEDAFDKYIINEEFRLVYEVNNENSKPTVRLVYRPDITPNFISPFTGKQLNENGEVYKKESTYSYNDIADCKQERAILLLADMGVGFDGNSYSPEKKITREEFKSLIAVLESSDTSLALNQKNMSVKRMDAIKQLITYAGLDKLAGYTKIYQTDFKDNKQIPKSYLGYVALAKALNIVSGKTVRPNDDLTRGEAADMIVNLMIAKSGL